MFEPVDMRIQAEAGLAEAAEEDVEQVGAVRMVVGRAEMRLRPRAERGVVEALAHVPGAVIPSFRIDSDTRERLAETERAQNPGRIGAELDAGADLPEGLRLLEQLGLDAAL